MKEKDDLYEVLQVHPSAEQEAIEAVYRRLARKYHPDTNASPDATEVMIRLNHAYEVLRDSAKRAAYDRERRQSLRSSSPAPTWRRSPSGEGPRSQQSPGSSAATLGPRGSVFTYTGMGKTNSVPFEIAAFPWNLYFRTSWTGHFALWVCGSRGSELVVRRVTSGELYHTLVEDWRGTLYFAAQLAPSDGEWTVWVAP